MTTTLNQDSVLTTGEVAIICKVAARTVSKWIDCGRLDGYKIPGSRDRRVTKGALEKFMRSHGLPLSGLTLECSQGTLLIVDAHCVTSNTLQEIIAQETKRKVTVVRSAFEAGMVCERSKPDAIIVDCNIGVNEAAGLASWLRSENKNARVVATGDALTADDQATLIRSGVSATMSKPFTVRAMLLALDVRLAQVG